MPDYAQKVPSQRRIANWEEGGRKFGEDEEEKAEAGNRRAMMVVMRVGDQFFLTGSTRWEASLASVHQKLDEPGWDGTATPISVDSATTRCTGQEQAT
jgi:hypothetical protein